MLQKEAARQGKKRRRLAEEEVKKKKGKTSDNQTKLVQFGIVHYKRCKKVCSELSFARTFVVEFLLVLFFLP